MQCDDMPLPNLALTMDKDVPTCTLKARFDRTFEVVPKLKGLGTPLRGHKPAFAQRFDGVLWKSWEDFAGSGNVYPKSWCFPTSQKSQDIIARYIGSLVAKHLKDPELQWFRPPRPHRKQVGFSATLQEARLRDAGSWKVTVAYHHFCDSVLWYVEESLIVIEKIRSMQRIWKIDWNQGGCI